jgi:hypothetical protein
MTKKIKIYYCFDKKMVSKELENVTIYGCTTKYFTIIEM